MEVTGELASNAELGGGAQRAGWGRHECAMAQRAGGAKSGNSVRMSDAQARAFPFCFTYIVLACAIRIFKEKIPHNNQAVFYALIK